MGNWDMPPKAEVESSCEKYRGRVEIAERLIDALKIRESYENPGSHQDEFKDIGLSDGRVVTVRLGLRNIKNYPEDLFRVYLQDGSRKKIEWEEFDNGDKRAILFGAYPDEDNIDYVLSGE